LYSNCFNGSTEGSKDLSIAQFELIDTNCSFYRGVSKLNPTTIGTAGYDLTLSNLIINGEKTTYSANVGDIVWYENTTTSAFYVLDEKQDKKGKSADKETWKKIDSTYVDLAFNR